MVAGDRSRHLQGGRLSRDRKLIMPNSAQKLGQIVRKVTILDTPFSFHTVTHMAEFTIVTRSSSSAWIPELIAAAGPEVTETYIDFFTATIRNRNTRAAYGIQALEEVRVT